MSIETLNGHVLLPELPNWLSQAELTRTWETEISETVTGAEDRGAMRAVPRLSLSNEIAPLTIEQRTRYEDRLRAALKSGMAAVPFWGRASDLANDASGTSVELATTNWPWQVNDHIFFLDASNLEAPIYAVRKITGKTGLTLTLDTALPQTFKEGSLVWPMLFGKPEINDQALVTTRQSSGQLTITELTGSTRASTSSAPTYLSRPIFITPINWTDGVSQSLSYDLRELQIGFGAEVFAPLQEHVVHGFGFNLQLNTETEILELENFFAALHGRLTGFWLPAPTEAFNIVSSISTTQFDITAQGLADTWEDHPAVHLWFTHNGSSAAAKIAGVSDNGNGTERVTLESALPFAPDATDMVSRLHYVRLTDDEENATFLAEWFEQRSIQVVELPTEYAAVETGEQPVYLYHIWIETQPTEQHWYYTSFASDITSNSQTYTAKPITHGELKTGIDGEAENATIDAFHEPGHPFLFGFPYPPARPIRVEIAETTYGDPNTQTILFTGQVKSAPRSGQKISASCVSLLDLDSQRLPNALIGPRCSYQVYDTNTCGISRSLWEKSGTITNINGRTLQITLSASFPAVDHWFAFGWIETGASSSEEIRTILDDTKISDTVRELKLDLPLQFAATTQAITLIRGCDGTLNTCISFFGENPNSFSGHPFVPDKNPSLAAINAPVSQGGKK